MQKIVLVLFFNLVLYAEDIHTLYQKAIESDLYKQMLHEIESAKESQKTNIYSDGFSIGAYGGYADVKDGSNRGSEAGISIAKNFTLGFSKIDRLLQKNQAYADTLKKIKLNQLKAIIFRLYGNYCITMDALQAKADLALTYEQIAEQIDRGVKFGEFAKSKSIMTHLSLENLNLEISKLETELQNYEAKLRSIVDFNGAFECKRIHPNFEAMFGSDASLYFNLFNEKKSVAKLEYALATQSFPSLSLEGSYSDEIDTRRYALSLTLPLSYGSNKFEAKKAAALQKLSATNFEIKAFAKRYLEESKALKRQLNIYKKYVKASEEQIKQASNELISQSKMRFSAGEESLLGVLQATQTKLNMIQNILDLKLKRHNSVADFLYTYAIDPQGVTK